MLILFFVMIFGGKKKSKKQPLRSPALPKSQLGAFFADERDIDALYELAALKVFSIEDLLRSYYIYSFYERYSMNIEDTISYMDYLIVKARLSTKIQDHSKHSFWDSNVSLQLSTCMDSFYLISEILSRYLVAFKDRLHKSIVVTEFDFQLILNRYYPDLGIQTRLFTEAVKRTDDKMVQRLLIQANLKDNENDMVKNIKTSVTAICNDIVVCKARVLSIVRNIYSHLVYNPVASNELKQQSLFIATFMQNMIDYDAATSSVIDVPIKDAKTLLELVNSITPTITDDFSAIQVARHQLEHLSAYYNSINDCSKQESISYVVHRHLMDFSTTPTIENGILVSRTWDENLFIHYQHQLSEYHEMCIGKLEKFIEGVFQNSINLAFMIKNGKSLLFYEETPLNTYLQSTRDLFSIYKHFFSSLKSFIGNDNAFNDFKSLFATIIQNENRLRNNQINHNDPREAVLLNNLEAFQSFLNDYKDNWTIRELLQLRNHFISIAYGKTGLHSHLVAKVGFIATQVMIYKAQ